MREVTVIICAYTEERWQELVAAVESLQRQTHLPDEIVLVIDHNRGLFERVEATYGELAGYGKQSGPVIKVVENRGKQGLSGARNSGLEIAQGSYIAFLDDDAEAEAEWLERLLNCCEQPEVLGVGGTVVPRWQGAKPQWLPPEFYWVIGCSYQREPAGPIVVRNPYGGCTCIKREVFQKVGGFREGIGREGRDTMGCEETELSIRAGQHWPQGVFLYEPRARIHHHVPVERTRWSYFLSRCYAEGLSKARICSYVGSREGLATERSYTLGTLPQGIVRHLGAGLRHGERGGILRAGAIVLGLVTTIVGYLRGNVGERGAWRGGKQAEE